MKRLTLQHVTVLILSFLLIAMPALIRAQSEQVNAGPPPVAPPIVREGDFAARLEFAYGLGTGEDEIEAETRLGAIGVAPRNGWIADYPVTPDIVGELQKAVSDAADSNKLSMSRDEALKLLDQAVDEVGSAIRPYTGAKPYAGPQGVENYPDPTVINNYYYEEGPPVVTYYAPPPDYYYLYGWVPYPFWCFGFFFPGFFILHDFHRVAFAHNRTVFISNHFNAVNVHRVFRVDPVSRFGGRTFAGIGAPRGQGFVSTGIPRSDRRIFNAPARNVPSPRMAIPPSGGSRVIGPPLRGPISPPLRGPVSGQTTGGGMRNSPSRGGGFSGGGHGGGGHGGGHGR